MDLSLILLILAATLIALVIFFISKSSKKVNDKKPNTTAQRQATNATNAVNAINRNRATTARDRLRNRLNARNNAADDNDADEDIDEVRNFALNLNENRRTTANNDEDYSGGDSDDGLNENQDWASNERLRKKIGTKKLAKMEAKAEKKEAHQQMLRDREERKEREKQLDDERKKRDEEEARVEKQKEEAEKKAREEQERREHEEYLKLKQQFSIEEEGHDEAPVDLDSQNLLQTFVEFIKKSKIVVLEDLAAEFKLKTQDAINRITQVENMGLLTGVMDDRGKYIFISQEELDQVCTFIRQRGRVSINELAQSSNDLINLKPVVLIDEGEEAVMVADS